jgi:hypothetical protein
MVVSSGSRKARKKVRDQRLSMASSPSVAPPRIAPPLASRMSPRPTEAAWIFTKRDESMKGNTRLPIRTDPFLSQVLPSSQVNEAKVSTSKVSTPTSPHSDNTLVQAWGLITRSGTSTTPLPLDVSIRRVCASIPRPACDS